MAKELVLTEGVVSLQSPQQLAAFAKTLKQFIVEQKLFTDIKGKNYVNVEGWEFAGACLGIFPVVKEVIDQSKPGEIKYKAVVQLVRIDTDKVVGGGEAICSSKENKRKNDDEYVIASMAQTRAIGKAYRNMLAWLMKVAGYEATPTEEVPVEVMPQEEMPVDTAFLPINEVMAEVGERLEAMEPHERIQALKTVNKLSTATLTERDWRSLYDTLKVEKTEIAPTEGQMSELRQAFMANKLLGPAVTEFTQRAIRKDKPETSDDVSTLLAALEQPSE